MIKNISICLLLLVTAVFAQQDNNLIVVVGNKMEGKTVNGELIREVFGNVVLTQGNVKVTCDHAIQFISRNNAELIGNVVLTQDSITIVTDRAFYYGDDRRAESYSGVTLNDKKVILSADSGQYFFNLDKAYFTHNVKLYDTVTTLTSKALTYFKKEDKIVAVGNVRIQDQESIITADSLEHFRNTRITFGYKNVVIKNFKNNIQIFGDHLEDYAQSKYTIVNLNPFLIQIDTIYTSPNDSLSSYSAESSLQSFRLDTLIIKSGVMESFRDTQNVFKATDSVKIIRENFASLNDMTIYNRDEQKIITKKINENAMQPILWYENSQLTGDSVTIFIRDNQIRLLDVDKKAFLLSQDSVYKNRFNQLSGDRIEVSFMNGEISKTEVFGGVHSIYYLYEEDTPNGLTKSSSKSALINFENKKVSEVRLYGSPNSEYYPENKVEGKELSFTLPDYVFHRNRPTKKELFERFNNKF